VPSADVCYARSAEQIAAIVTELERRATAGLLPDPATGLSPEPRSLEAKDRSAPTQPKSSEPAGQPFIAPPHPHLISEPAGQPIITPPHPHLTEPLLAATAKLSFLVTLRERSTELGVMVDASGAIHHLTVQGGETDGTWSLVLVVPEDFGHFLLAHWTQTEPLRRARQREARPSAERRQASRRLCPCQVGRIVERVSGIKKLRGRLRPARCAARAVCSAPAATVGASCVGRRLPTS
jgi:hypothetical protein